MRLFSLAKIKRHLLKMSFCYLETYLIPFQISTNIDLIPAKKPSAKVSDKISIKYQATPKTPTGKSATYSTQKIREKDMTMLYPANLIKEKKQLLFLLIKLCVLRELYVNDNTTLFLRQFSVMT